MPLCHKYLHLQAVHRPNKDLPTNPGLLLIHSWFGMISPWITSMVEANRHAGESDQMNWLHRMAISQIKPNTASEANSQLTVTIHWDQQTRGALDWMMSRSWQELAAFLINLWPVNSAGCQTGWKTYFYLIHVLKSSRRREKDFIWFFIHVWHYLCYTDDSIHNLLLSSKPKPAFSIWCLTNLAIMTQSKQWAWPFLPALRQISVYRGFNRSATLMVNQ